MANEIVFYFYSWTPIIGVFVKWVLVVYLFKELVMLAHERRKDKLDREDWSRKRAAIEEEAKMDRAFEVID